MLLGIFLKFVKQFWGELENEIVYQKKVYLCTLTLLVNGPSLSEIDLTSKMNNSSEN